MTDISTTKFIDLDLLSSYSDKLKEKLPDIYVGATSTSDAVTGTVPAATSAEKDKYLKGDGTWGTPGGVEGSQSDWEETDTSAISYIKNKPTIPDELSDLTDDSTHRVVTDTQIADWDAKTSNIGTITEVKVNGTSYGTSGVVNLPAYPTTLPASDVSEWAKASTKPTYTASEVGALADTTTHLSGDVPITRTVNGKALSTDITLSASDIGALPSSTIIPTVTDTYSATSTDAMSGKAVASAISGKVDSATTLAGYGITDAKISSGTVTLGSNSITPLTASSTLDASKVSGTLPSSTYTDTTYVFNTAYNASTNKAATMSDISSAISGVTQFDYEIVTSLPSTGVKGKIYLVANSGSGSNVYDEYIYVNSKFELMGTTQIDISGKVDKTTTIAGVDLKDNITKAEMLTALNVEDGSEVNTIETVKVNGTALTPSSKAVDITVPTKTSELTNDSGYKTTDNNTTYSFAEGSTNGAFSVTPSGGSASSVAVHGLAGAAYKAVDTSIAASSTSANLPTSAAVASFVEGKGYKTTDNNTTYTLTQDSSDGHKITLTPSSGTAQTITIPDNNTTYSSKTAASGGTDVSLVTTGEKYTWNNKTSNTGTVTSIKVEGANGLSGSGTVTTSGTITLSNAGVRSITQDSSDGHKLTINTNGTSSTITIPDNNTTYSAATTSAAGLMSASDKTKLDGIATGANAYSLPTASSSTLGGVKVGTNLSISNGVLSATNTTYSDMTAATSSAAGTHGLVPAPAAGKQTSFLRGDGTWVVPTNTTYSDFVKSGTGAAHGLVPAPSTTAGTTKYLREDGTWQVPPDNNTTYSAATTSAAGLMSASDKTKLDGIATGANAYTHPTTSGNKHIPSGGSSGQILRWSADGTAAWGADNNTTYSAATTSANGLMSSTDKSKLDGIESGAIRIHKALTSNGTTATTTKGYTYGVAGVTTSPYTYSKWYAYLDSGVTALTDGMIIAIRIPVAGVSYGCCVTIDGTNFHPVCHNSSDRTTTHFVNGVELVLMYDSKGSCSVYSNSASAAAISGVWRVLNNYDSNSNTTLSGIATCSTAAATAAKVGTMPGFGLSTNQSIILNVTIANTSATALTLNVNGTGAKAIYLSGKATSTTNYSLPVGYYVATYNGTYWNLVRVYWTDNNTTYSSKDAASGGTDLSLVTTGEKYTWNNKTSNTGTVTSVATGTGLTGGTITTSGTISLASGVATAGTAGTSSATSGSTLAVPYVTVDTYGRVTGYGTHTHTVSGFSTTDTKNTAGSTDTSSKLFLIGATSQAANPQTYSQDTAYVGTDGCLYSGGTKVSTTDTKVTAVGNHYTPSGGTTISASGGTLTDITNSSSGVQVLTGITKDAAGHVTGVTSIALKSTNDVILPTTAGTEVGAIWLE